MNVKTRFMPLLAVFMTFFVLVSPAYADEDEQYTRIVSLASVLSDFQEFDQQKIRIVGYLVDEALTTLFLTRDHARHKDYGSSLVVELGKFYGKLPDVCMPGYVTLTGTLRLRSGGLFRLTDIESVGWVKEAENFPRDCLSQTESY